MDVAVRVGVLDAVTIGLGVRVGVKVRVGVLVAVEVGDTTFDGVYVRTEITAGWTDKFSVYMNHLPVVASLNVAGVA